jgi:hypothetical protein
MSQNSTVDPSHLIASNIVLDELRKSIINDLQELHEPLVYASVINLFRVHSITSIPVFDDDQNKFIAIVNVVNIMRFLMLNEVFNKIGSPISNEKGGVLRKNKQSIKLLNRKLIISSLRQSLK